MSSARRMPHPVSRRAMLHAAIAVIVALASLAFVPRAQATTSFISTWQTENTSTGSSAANEVRLPLQASGTYNFSVDWGDGSSDTITSYNQAEVTHTYASSGTKTITITGTIRGWRFNNSGDRLKITDISSWGPLQLGNDGGYFYGAANLDITATDEPDLSLTTNLANIFFNASDLTGSQLADWDITGVTSLASAFRGAASFDGDIGQWNTSAVTAMNSAFRDATSFDQDLSGWDTGNVTTTSSMFRNATGFDQSLAAWQVGELTDASNMFAGAGVSRANYDALLESWGAQSVKPAVTFDAGSSKYTVGAPATARGVLVNDNQWVITDAGATDVPGVPPNVAGTRAPEAATITWGAAAPNNEAVIDYTVTGTTAAEGIADPEPCVRPAAESRSCTFTGLTNGVTYSFSVTARNVVGSSAASDAVDVIPQIDPPSTPAQPQAVALDEEAYVVWDAPSGGGTPQAYTVTADPGGNTCTTQVGVDDDPLRCTVTGLTNGTDYTFTVRAENVGGESAQSEASEPVTPGPVFASTWDTSRGANPNRLRLPLQLDGTYDFVVAWGDGSVSQIVSSDVTPEGVGIEHTYDNPGVYDVTITGTIRGWSLNEGPAGTNPRNKLIGISSWGPLRLQTPTVDSHYFADATNLQVTATDALDLTGTTSLAHAFDGATSFNGTVGNWDTQNVTDLTATFKGATSFDQDVSGWDTGAVTSMAQTFQGATSFDQELSDWDVSSVTTTDSMLRNATAFNSAVSWTAAPALVTTADMFAGATSFNQPLAWPVSLPQLTTTARMFQGATSFDSSVAALDLDAVTDASQMFAGASAFNQDLSAWDTGSVTDASSMFAGATSFDQDLSGWDFEAITRFGDFLQDSGIGIHHYNRFLGALAAQDVQPDNSEGSTEADRTIDSSPAQYSEGIPAANRAEIVGRGFTVIDGGATNQNVPDAPTAVQVDGDSGDYDVSWAPPNDNNSPITSYTVTARRIVDPTIELVLQTTDVEAVRPSVTFEGLLPGGASTYLFFVTATNAIGTSAPSDTSAPETPAAPSVVADDGQVTVSVSLPETGANPATYLIEEVGDPSKTCTITVPDTSCVVTGLTNGAPYAFKAKASNWVGDSAFSPPSDNTAPGIPFRSTWRTGNNSTGSSDGDQIRLPLTSGGVSDYDFYVSWGDGTTDHITAYDQAEVTHTYARAGTRDVTITGTIRGWRFNNGGDRLKLLDISQWGPLELGNQGGYFYGAANLTGTATDAPNLTLTHDLSNAFLDAGAFTGDVATWNTTGITDLTNAFKGTTAFTGTGLGSWDVSNVTDMFGTFQNSGVTADISGWNVGNVTDMNQTFAGATAFNQAIGSWDVSSVQDMANMFKGASSFDQDLSGWNTISVTDMSGLFWNSGFAGDISAWDITSVTDFANLFRNSGGPTGAEAVGWYNRLLIGWAAQDVYDSSSVGPIPLTVCGTADVVAGDCDAGAPQYSPGAPTRARQRLISLGWQIIDGGQADTTVPSRVQNLDVTGAGSAATVTWEPPASLGGLPLTAYTVTPLRRVDLSAADECPASEPYSGEELDPAPSATCDLPDGTWEDYYFEVTASNAAGTSAAAYYPVLPTPEPPIVVPGNRSVRVVVPESDDGTQHVVSVTSDPQLACTVTAPDTSCLIDGLTNGTEYTFRTRTIVDSSMSDYSPDSDPATPGAALFTSTWDTTNTSTGSSGGRTVALPLVASGTYDFTVNWGDGTTSRVTAYDDPDARHVYEAAGEKQLSLSGQIDGWAFRNSGDRRKISDISNWGALRLGNTGGYFHGAELLSVSATDSPDLTGTADMSDAFREARAFNHDIGAWDVSAVTDMSGMFASAESFDQDLSGWDTGNVADMSGMFQGSGFTGEVADWDISQVTTFEDMFRDIPAMTGVEFINWYNRLLVSWASQPVQPDAVFTACGSVSVAPEATDCPGGLQFYGPAASWARWYLNTQHGWLLIDGGLASANVPDAPTGFQLVREGSTLHVSWTAALDNGDPVTEYTITADPGGATCTTDQTTCDITGLSDDPEFRYSVTGTATNSLGTSQASQPYPMVRPGSPGTPAAVAGDASATVTVSPSTAGGEPSRYRVTANPGGATCDITELSGALECEVPGLTNGTAYTFTATADNDGGTSDASAPSNSVTPLGAAVIPSFGAVTRTPDGFTVPILNYVGDAGILWEASVRSGGASVSLDAESGLITVTGAAPAESVTVDVTTSRADLEPGSADQAGVALEVALDPVFADDVTRTADGFTVTLANYLTGSNATDYDWDVVDPDDAGPIEAALNPETGLITVSGAAPGQLVTITVTTTRDDYAPGSADQDGTALDAALDPIFADDLTRTADGFTVTIANYLTGTNATDYTWNVSDPDDERPIRTALDSATGVVSVTGAEPGETVTVTVTTTRSGFDTGATDATGQALQAALDPTFGSVSRTPDGFTVPVANYLTGSNNTDYAWSVVDPDDAGPITTELNSETGLVTVSGASPGESVTVTVRTTREGHVPGTADRAGTALEEALDPTFGSVTRTADGFTVTLANYLTGSNNTDYTWDVVDPDDAGPINVALNPETGLVTVSGAAPGQLVTITVTTTRDDYAPGSADQDGTALEAALTPTFGPVTRTADGFVVTVTNYLTGTNNTDYQWFIPDPDDDGPIEVTPDITTGTVTVTGATPGQSVTFTVTTTREGYVTGSADQAGTALEAALDPVFAEDLTRTADGFTVTIANYLANSDAYVWTLIDPDTDGPVGVALDEATGLATVTGVAPGASVDLTVTTTLTGYVEGTATQDGTALNAAHVPAFGAPTATDDGFTVQITNFDDEDVFTWSLGEPTPDGSEADLDQVTGLVTVTGVDPGTDASVTVFARDPGYVEGSAPATGRSRNGAALTPTFAGDVTRTADGFTVEITNFGAGDPYTWSVAGSTPENSSAELDQATGVVTVSNVAPDTEATVSIETDRRGYDTGRETAVGRSLKAAQVPAFGTVERTPDGFTVPVSNLDAEDAFTWEVTESSPQSADVDLDEQTGLLSVSALDPDTEASVTIRTTRADYAAGSNTVIARSLKAALVPALGSATRLAGGFDIPVTNFATEDPYTWAVTVRPDSVSADIVDGVIEVRGLTDGQTATVTVTATRDEHATGSTEESSAALAAALTPQFGDRTRTADGFRFPIPNYDARFDWTAETSAGQASVSADGVLVVTELTPDASADVTVTTQRDGYRQGSADTSGSALSAALVPQFGTTQRTPDGFTVRVTNYDAAFGWQTTASRTADEVSIDDTGRILVTGLAPGEESVLRVRTSRNGHADGTAETTVAAQAGSALTPQFGTVTPTASGFTVRIVNHLSSFAWSATASAGTASIDSSGTVTVTGLAAEQASVVRVTSTRSGYESGSGEVVGAALPATPTVTAPASVPAAPSIVSTKAKTTTIALAWLAGGTGGSPITGATATCRTRSGDQVRTASGTSGTLTVKKLKKGTRYRCSVTATNAVGTSVQSAIKDVKTKSAKSKKAKNKKSKSKAKKSKAQTAQRQNGSTS